VNNVAPIIDSVLTGPIEPVQIDTSISIIGSFYDPGTLDTHTATIEWGDITEGPIEVLSPFELPHIYTEPGVYNIKLTITDDDGGSDTETYDYYIVVYDPNGGFVTGGGWIDSPEGAYKANTSLTGKANFGFVSKYKKGQDTPTGNTEFQFKAGDINFHSKDYEWLVIIIAGAKAMFKGTGTINGEGSYKFILTGIDEKLTSSTDVDRFRIRIWEEDEFGNEIVIYDNHSSDDINADPETEISGGNIVIHKK
jgi:PKD repeat protein